MEIFFVWSVLIILFIVSSICWSLTFDMIWNFIRYDRLKSDSMLILGMTVIGSFCVYIGASHLRLIA